LPAVVKHGRKQHCQPALDARGNMRCVQRLAGLLALALVVAHVPAYTNAQAGAGGLATAPATATAGGATAAAPAASPLSAQSIASSINGGSLGTVSTGGSWKLSNQQPGVLLCMRRGRQTLLASCVMPDACQY